MHKVLVNRLFKLTQANSVARTDRPDMTIAVEWDVKQQNKQTNLHNLALYASATFAVATSNSLGDAFTGKNIIRPLTLK